MGETFFVDITWLESLRTYPRWLVLSCAAVVTGGLLVLVGKSLKWAIYIGLAGLLVVLLAVFAWWLEQ